MAAALTVEVLSVPELDADLERTWRAIQSEAPELGSPYFSPDFTLAVGQVRDDVRIAVLERDGAVVGFLPFQRGPRRCGRPVGYGVSDLHGIIAGSSVAIDVEVLLARSGLRSFVFDHLLASRSGFERWATATTSPVIDLRRGADGWCADRCAAHPTGFGQVLRKARQLRRNGREVHYQRHSEDIEVLRELMTRKSEQYRRTKVTDVFAFGWVTDLLELLHKTHSPVFSGRLSALWIDGELASAHMGMVTDRVWHYWFPVYTECFARSSPGLVLLLEMALDGGAQGLQELDLGRGDSRFKREFANGSVPLLVGSIGDGGVASGLTRRLGPAAVRAGNALRHTPMAAPLRPAVHALGMYRKGQRFR